MKKTEHFRGPDPHKFTKEVTFKFLCLLIVNETSIVSLKLRQSVKPLENNSLQIIMKFSKIRFVKEVFNLREALVNLCKHDVIKGIIQVLLPSTLYKHQAKFLYLQMVLSIFRNKLSLIMHIAVEQLVEIFIDIHYVNLVLGVCFIHLF